MWMRLLPILWIVEGETSWRHNGGLRQTAYVHKGDVAAKMVTNRDFCTHCRRDERMLKADRC